MSKITIKNIGPINNVEIDLNKVNIIMGPQSSGKSTIAKIISYCQWVEKRYILDGGYDYKFSEQFINFHRIDKNYFRRGALINYESEFISITYTGINAKESIESKNNKVDYQKSKNIYIPAERNFVSVIPNLGKYKETNDNIMSFLYDWYDVKRKYSEEKTLPVLNLGVAYHHIESGDADILTLKNEKEISLKNASSGLQSVIPLTMLVHYLAHDFYDEKFSTPINEMEVLLSALRKLKEKTGVSVAKKIVVGRIKYHHSKFIIEEPEQNLFPETQRDLVYFLLEKINHPSRDHKITITTHSPYILYALNNCMMGYNVKEDMPDGVKAELPSHKSWIDHKLVSVWEIKDGKIKSIQDENTGTVSKHYFNRIMNNIMDEYYEMLNYLEV